MEYIVFYHPRYNEIIIHDGNRTMWSQTGNFVPSHTVNQMWVWGWVQVGNL